MPVASSFLGPSFVGVRSFPRTSQVVFQAPFPKYYPAFCRILALQPALARHHTRIGWTAANPKIYSERPANRPGNHCVLTSKFYPLRALYEEIQLVPMIASQNAGVLHAQSGARSMHLRHVDGYRVGNRLRRFGIFCAGSIIPVPPSGMVCVMCNGRSDPGTVRVRSWFAPGA